MMSGNLLYVKVLNPAVKPTDEVLNYRTAFEACSFFLYFLF